MRFILFAHSLASATVRQYDSTMMMMMTTTTMTTTTTTMMMIIIIISVLVLVLYIIIITCWNGHVRTETASTPESFHIWRFRHVSGPTSPENLTAARRPERLSTDASWPATSNGMQHDRRRDLPWCTNGYRWSNSNYCHKYVVNEAWRFGFGTSNEPQTQNR